MKKVKKINTNEFRMNLTKYLTKNIGDTIYITKYGRLVAELNIYTDKEREEAKLDIARGMVKAADKNWLSLSRQTVGRVGLEREIR